MPSVARETEEFDDFDSNASNRSARSGAGQRIPRRTSFLASSAASTLWWRPRTGFGRILLGTGIFVVLALAIALAVVTRGFLTRDAHFRIPGAASIQSTGLSEVNRAEILPVFGEDIGRNIFFVPLSERRKQLEAIPWVKQATVMRFLPDHLTISILERTPVAFVRQGSQIELADADGVILSMPPALMAQHHYSFPVVTGIDQKDSLTARRARMAVYQRFIAELDQNQQHRTAQVSEIDLSDPEDLRATMPEQGSDILAHFGEDQFLPRLQVYKAHIEEWRQRYPKLIGVDLRYNGEVPLEMASGGNGPSSAKIAAIGTSSTTQIKPLKVAKAASGKPKLKSASPSSAQHKAAETHLKSAQSKAAQSPAAKAKVVHNKLPQHTQAQTSTLNQ